MAGFPNYSSTPVQNLVGQVVSPAGMQNPDGTIANVTLGRSGELFQGQLHGNKYASRARGNGFVANINGVAGSAIPVAGGTAGVALLYNPVGSGVLVELEKIRITTGSTATDIIAGLVLEGSLQTPSATTAAVTVSGSPLGNPNGTPKALALKAATITAMTMLFGLGISLTATTSAPGVAEVDFDGTCVLAPGYAVNLAASIVQTSGHLIVDFFWSEWLP